MTRYRITDHAAFDYYTKYTQSESFFPVTRDPGRNVYLWQRMHVDFNHERFMLISQSVAVARYATEECFKWANQRKVFNKRLIDQPVIRNKLARMVSKDDAPNIGQCSLLWFQWYIDCRCWECAVLGGEHSLPNVPYGLRWASWQVGRPDRTLKISGLLLLFNRWDDELKHGTHVNRLHGWCIMSRMMLVKFLAEEH